MAVRCYLKLLLLFFVITSCLCAKPKTNDSKNKYTKYSNNQTKDEPVKPQEHNFTRARNVMKEIPTKEDLVQYLRSINKIVKFCDANRNEIDLNFAFGLFLINVNLKTVVRHKSRRIPLSMKKILKDTLMKNDEILSFFKGKVKRDNNPANKINKLLYSLFSNETVWIERLVRYDNSVFPGARRPSEHEQLTIYKTWDHYQRSVDNWNGMVPNEQQSDECIASLAHNQVRVFESLPTCNLVELCYTIIVNGSDFGYALTHRILLLLTARYGRGCAVFSPTTDRELMNRFCANAYVEAEYIAAHNFGAIDLLMEQMMLCGIIRQYQFLRRSWLAEILKRQKRFGCFGTLEKFTRIKVTTRKKWSMVVRGNAPMKFGHCSRHTTNYAMGALGVAVKFLSTLFL